MAITLSILRVMTNVMDGKALDQIAHNILKCLSQEGFRFQLAPLLTKDQVVNCGILLLFIFM